MLYLLSNATISELYHIVSHFSESETFEIMKTITKEIIAPDDDKKLLDYDLFPNSRLVLKEKKWIKMYINIYYKKINFIN